VPCTYLLARTPPELFVAARLIAKASTDHPVPCSWFRNVTGTRSRATLCLDRTPEPTGVLRCNRAAETAIDPGNADDGLRLVTDVYLARSLMDLDAWHDKSLGCVEKKLCNPSAL
jgi:hypothetical protein